MLKGEVAVVVGDSGSGKSTLLHFIAGLLAPRGHRRFRFGVPLGYIECERADGNVIVEGDNITDYKPKDRHIGLVLQDYSVYEHMTVEENLLFPLKLRGESEKSARKKVEDMANMLYITDVLKQRPNELSGGQRQRVSLGKLLLKNPTLVLLDEAFAHIDPLIEEDIITVLHKNLNNGNTALRGIVIVTHDLKQTTIADHIILFRLYPDGIGPKHESRNKVFSKIGNCSALDSMKSNSEKLFEPWCKRVEPFVSKVSQ
jgi:ABC-type sugar transport system ATPase subunit